MSSAPRAAIRIGHDLPCGRGVVVSLEEADAGVERAELEEQGRDASPRAGHPELLLVVARKPLHDQRRPELRKPPRDR